MRITEIINGGRPSLSFEVFPPKTSDSLDTVKQATEEIARLKPSYMSVTYGAGGGTSQYTTQIAKSLSEYGVTPLAHLSCISSTRAMVLTQLDSLRTLGIENILALRGDIPDGMSMDNTEYRYASELTSEIRDYGGFCIGGACYPEGHPESKDINDDIDKLKIKIECGCEFLTTQMFFENGIYYTFKDRLGKYGINTPTVAGIMPVTSVKQIQRILTLSGNTLPKRLLELTERYADDPEAMKQAGIEYATEQALDLYAHGIHAVHIYSMNKADVARKIQENLAEITK